MTERTAITVAQQIADLAEELTTVTTDTLPNVLIALSRASAHLADFVAAAPAHYPHMTKRAADQIQNAAGSLEVAIDAELNPPASEEAGVCQHGPQCRCADCSERVYLDEVERQNAAEVAEVLDFPSGRHPELMLGGEL